MSNLARFPAQFLGNFWQSETKKLQRLGKWLRTITDICKPNDMKTPTVLSTVFYRFCADSLEGHEF